MRSLTPPSRVHLLRMRAERDLLLYQLSLNFIAAFMGCLYAGMVAVPGYFSSRAPDLSVQLK